MARAVYDTFVEDARVYYDGVPLGARFKGIEGVRGFYQSIATAVPDLHIEVISEYDVPGCSIREVVITGTHQGEFAGVKPLGNAIRIEMAAFYTFDAGSGKLISEQIYYDQASLLEQMQGTQKPLWPKVAKPSKRDVTGSLWPTALLDYRDFRHGLLV
ncbi:MAG: ester cyclase [Candidatus Sulfotelmatobacter sp.]